MTALPDKQPNEEQISAIVAKVLIYFYSTSTCSNIYTSARLERLYRSLVNQINNVARFLSPGSFLGPSMSRFSHASLPPPPGAVSFLPTPSFYRFSPWSPWPPLHLSGACGCYVDIYVDRAVAVVSAHNSFNVLIWLKHDFWLLFDFDFYVTSQWLWTDNYMTQNWWTSINCLWLSCAIWCHDYGFGSMWKN